jgi:hypothetical protein
MKFILAFAIPAAGLVAYVSTTGSAAEPTPEVARNAGIPSAQSLGARCPIRSRAARYVSPRGSDASPGTRRRPWRTLQKGLDAIKPGQTLLLRAGTYREWATVRRSGEAGRPIVIRGHPGERAVITGRLKIDGSHVCVTRLVFHGRTTANSRSVLIYVSGGDWVHIRGNEIRSAAISGIFVGDEDDGADDAVIVGNYVHDNGTNEHLDHGIYFGHGRRGLIANNLVERNFAGGVKLAPEALGVVSVQNTVVSNGEYGILVGGDTNWTSKGNIVANNIVAGNGTWGIRSYWDSEVGTENIALRNLVWQNDHGAFWFPGGGLSEEASILDDPRFLTAESGDYRVGLGSPALDVALRQYSMPFDRGGRSRLGRRPDLGAYER